MSLLSRYLRVFNMNTYVFHQPVMEKEVLHYLLRKDGIYVDATVGGGATLYPFWVSSMKGLYWG